MRSRESRRVKATSSAAAAESSAWENDVTIAGTHQRCTPTRRHAENPLHTFPRNFPVDVRFANLLRTCYGETDAMDFGLNRQTDRQTERQCRTEVGHEIRRQCSDKCVGENDVTIAAHSGRCGIFAYTPTRRNRHFLPA